MPNGTTKPAGPKLWWNQHDPDVAAVRSMLERQEQMHSVADRILSMPHFLQDTTERRLVTSLFNQGLHRQDERDADVVSMRDVPSLLDVAPKMGPRRKGAADEAVLHIRMISMAEYADRDGGSIRLTDLGKVVGRVLASSSSDMARRELLRGAGGGMPQRG